MEHVKRLYADFRHPVLIISSIVTQILLITLSYRRIRNLSRSPAKRIIWTVVHFASDYVATVSLWSIFHAYMEPKESHGGGERGNNRSLGFWAPFILVHLGRHGKVTAFYLQDNEFWPKQALTFIFYECTALFICILAALQIPIIWPSIIFFIVGTSKLGERIWSLNFGSMKRLNSILDKPEPGSDLHEMMSALTIGQRRGELAIALPGDHHGNIMLLDDSRTLCSRDQITGSLCSAYNSFNRYKGLYADVRFTSIIRNNISTTPFGDEENSIEVELGFAHDLFYTKSLVMHTRKGWIVRGMNMILVVVASSFIINMDKHSFYTIFLPIATILLELGSFFDAAISKWTLVKVGYKQGDQWRMLEEYIQGIRTRIEFLCPIPSLQVGQHSIMSFCSNDRYTESWAMHLLGFLELKEFWDNTRNTRYISFNGDLKAKIIEQISQRLEDDRNLINNGSSNPVLAPLGGNVIQQIGSDMNIENVTRPLQIGEAFIIWHLATDLCCQTFHGESLPADLRDAKVISDYMMYLLVECSPMLASFSRAEYYYQDACAAVRKFISHLCNDEVTRGQYYQILKTLLVDDDDKIISEAVSSLLLDAFKIARELKLREQTFENNNNKGENPWNLLLQFWVSLLSHAAFYCKGQNHARQLSTGGELLTYVWIFLIRSFIG